MRLALLTLVVTLPVALVERDAHAQPANDACASAIVIGALPYTDTRNITNATAAVDDPAFECAESDFGGEPSVWYRYTATQAISLQIDTFGSTLDTLLAVHEGVCGLFTDLRACNNDDYDIDDGSTEDSRLIVTLAAGETLHVEVLDWQEQGGTYTLHVTETPVVQVSRYTERGHRPSVATAPGGGFMVVWSGRDPGGDDPVFGRKLSPTGLPAGAKFPLSTTPAQFPRPSLSSSGSDLVAVWRADSSDVVGRRIDPSGMAVGGEFTVADDGYDPQVAADPLGNFMVVWIADDGIRARRFDALNVPQGSSFLVNTSTDDVMDRPAIAADGDGNFVVVWEGEDDDSHGILGQRLDGDGLPIGTEFQVNSTTTGSQRYGVVTADPDGNFLVAWADDECFYCIDARGFDAAGAPVGPSVRIDDGDAATTCCRPIATSVDGNGTFTVAWTDDYQIVSRRLDASAAPLGNTFIVTPFRDGYLYNPSVAAAAGGEFVVSWEWSPYGSHYDVMSRLVLPADDSPCPATPFEGCRMAAVAGKSTLLMKDRVKDESDAVTWKWARGSATTLADFGDPLADGTYRFCVYDDDVLVLAAAIPEGGTCGDKPCWKAKGAKGFNYADGQATPDGIKSIVLRAGEDGKASVTVKGKGPALRGPDLPVRAFNETRAQLVAGNGVCWETPFDDFEIDVNTASDFKAVGP